MGFDFKQQMCIFDFDKNTYDITFSNAAAFAFLQYRFYVRLNSLLLEDSQQILEQHINEGDFGNPFTLVLEDGEGKPAQMTCLLEPVYEDEPDIIRFKCFRCEFVEKVYGELELAKKESYALISQYTDVIYSYNHKNGEMTCYRESPEEKVMVTDPLEVFESRFREKLTPDSYEEMSKYISNLHLGTRSFANKATSATDNSRLNLTGVAVYDGHLPSKTLGRIGGYGMPAFQMDLYDQLTGTYMKQRITDYARHRINDLHEKTAIAIIDLDDFKQINDNFGHSKGDEVLRKTTDIIMKSCGGMGKVGRIGGDEFFVVYDDFEDIQQIRFSFMSMQSYMSNTFTEYKEGFNMTLSIGCAVYPNDYNGTFEDMFKITDAFLYRAKDKGKSRYIVYNYEKHGPIEDILRYGFKKIGLDRSELVCRLANSVIQGEHIELDEMIPDIARYFAVERVVLYNKTDRFVKAQSGLKHLTLEKIRRTISYLYEDGLIREYKNDSLTINCVDHFEQRAPKVYKKLIEQSTFALQQYLVHGKSGKEYVLSMECLSGVCSWNINDVQYYKIIVKILEQIL